MEHKLEFLNPQYHKGVNVTIRKGNKWYQRASIGDTVGIYRTGDEDCLVHGTIVDLRYSSYRQVFLQDLLEEHDIECRNPAGLTLAMLRAYPDFNLDDTVTIIRFEID